MMNATEDDAIDFIDNCRSEFKKLKPEEIHSLVQYLML